MNKFKEGQLVYWLEIDEMPHNYPLYPSELIIKSGKVKYDCGNEKLAVENLDTVAYCDRFYMNREELIRAFIEELLKELTINT